MSWVVAIDESGNLGSSTRYFVMAAIIFRRPRVLNSAFAKIPVKKYESKFYNSTDDEISKILTAINSTDIKIVTSIVDKHNYKSRFYGIHGNELYKKVLLEVLQTVSFQISGSDASIILDRCSFITLDELRSLGTEILHQNNCQLKKCEKRISEQAPCIQIVDYVAGAIYHNVSYNDSKFLNLIKEKVVVARTD